MNRAALATREELTQRIAWFEGRGGKLLEAQRIKMRTELRFGDDVGVWAFAPESRNYSRHSRRTPGPARARLAFIDFFPRDYLLMIDESHATLPQIGGMYAGDMARKTVLVEYGFRLPSALDNRPLNFEEFQSLEGQAIYASATPTQRELDWSVGHVAEFGRSPDRVD